MDEARLYSFRADDGVFHISSLSDYSAMYDAGVISEQSLQDHGSAPNVGVNAEMNGGSSTRENQTRDIVSGRVYGYLKYKDQQGNEHPLVGVKVKLTFTASWGTAEGYTNSSGYYDISFHDYWTLWAFESDIHIYAENSMARVANSSNTVYEKAERLTDFPNGGTKLYSYTFDPVVDGDLGKAMMIFTGLKNYADYAQALNGGTAIEQCTVRYPTDNGAYYSNGYNYICLGKESMVVSGCPAVYASWDVIGHEYGHHLQKHFFNRDYFGTHYAGVTDFETYLWEKNESGSGAYVLPSSDEANAKKQSMGLAWKESWPTFFAISAQKSFSSAVGSVATVGDSAYTAFNGVYQNLNTFNQHYGETSEDTIMAFLYQLWDTANSTSDKLSISDSDLWTIMVSSNPEFFCDFISALYSSGLAFNRSDLGLLLEAFLFSASNLVVTADPENYAVIPSFSWQKNGYDITYMSHTYFLSNDKFDLVFYDASMSFVFQRTGLIGSSYTLSASEWNQIIALSGTTYYVMVKSYDTFGVTSGPYYSKLYSFTKPTSASSTPSLGTLSSKRYFEQTIAIAPGAKWRMTLSFPYSGKKAIQTFGNKDTKIWLYQADGTTLIGSNDDSGYGTNAFTCLDAVANTNYILEVGYYSSYVSGETKVSITPFVGCLADGQTSYSSYESFVNINTYPTFTWGSYLFGNSSKIVTWSPPEDGNYTVRLESDFDNYLYVVDPTSSAPLVMNVDYNDDSNGSTNASLTNDYSSSKKYYVVYAQYNNGNDLGNENSISVKFIKN